MITEEQSYFHLNAADEALYHKATAGLPPLAVGEPYGSGPHNMRAFRYAMEKASVVTEELDIIPPHVFEIGFNLGYSAAIWLELGAVHVHSIDIRGIPRMREAEKTLHAHYGADRLTVEFERTVANCSPPRPGSLAFIDGGHDYKDVKTDVDYCLKQGITRFLFDDWPPRYGPGVQPVILEYELMTMAVLGSMAYVIVPASEGWYRERGK